MRILVTGSSGFLGRHFVEELELHRGDDVVGVDVRPGFHTDQVRDCRDFFAYDRSRWDLIVHLAGIVGGRARIEGDPLALAVNLELDAALFRWVAETRQPHVVYMSSSAVYPTSMQAAGQHYRLIERVVDPRHDAFSRPDELYGWAKLSGEVLAQRVRERDTIVTVMRPFSGYGSDQDLDYPFPSFIRRALDLDDPFTVWGDGTQARDFVHVDDVVGATLAAVDAKWNDALNVCSGVATSFNELQRLVCREAGYEPRVEHVTDAPRGVAYRVGAPGKMLEVYGRPRVSLIEGIRRALEEMK